jgi:hypothetical protein
MQCKQVEGHVREGGRGEEGGARVWKAGETQRASGYDASNEPPAKELVTRFIHDVSNSSEVL